MENTNMENINEITPDELGAASGGVVAGGLKKKPAPKSGYILHQITATDTVWNLSRHYGCTMDAILEANPSIEDKRLIRTGFWLYIPKKK